VYESENVAVLQLINDESWCQFGLPPMCWVWLCC